MSATSTLYSQAQSELSALATSAALSELQPPFDDAVAAVESSNTLILAARLLDALAVIARNLGSSDAKVAQGACRLNARNPNFKRRISDAHGHSRPTTSCTTR